MADELSADRLFAALATWRVEFIVIGGFSVIAHGYVRATKDLDIVPDPAPDNLARLADVLAELNAAVRGMEEFEADELPRPDREGLALGGNFVLDTEVGRLDILQIVAPELGFDDLLPGSELIEALGHRFRVCGYEDLVRMKEAAGREEDRLDLKRLREARG